MMKPILTIIIFLLGFSSFAQKEPYLIIGTYTGGQSKGIYVYKFDTANAESKFISTIPSSNPSFLAISPDQQFVFAVNEDAGTEKFPGGGAVSSFSFDKKKGTLTAINTQFSGGKHPCYITTDAVGKWLFAGNYSSGNVGLFQINKDGSIGKIKQLIQHSGSGPDTGRQKAAHVHSTILSKNQQWLFVPDLGIDKVMVYQFNKEKGILKEAPAPFASSQPGSGPRHFELDANNNYAYLMEELTGTVVVYKFEQGSLISKQRISALPEDFKAYPGSADIHISPDGNFLYCSNRGESNSITIFRINNTDGTLTVSGHQSTLGKTPRNFNFDPSGNFLLVANQQTDEIVVFKIDKQTGLLTDTGKRIVVPSPVCLKWIR